MKEGDFSFQFVCQDSAGRTEDWRHSDTTRLVAVLAALGIPVETQRVWRDKEGDERVTYLHGPRSLHTHRAALPVAKELARLYRSGELARTDPLHPLLDGLRSIANHRALRIAQPHGLALCTPARCLLVPADQYAPRNPSCDFVRTANIHRAAALALLGYPLLAITSPEAGKPVYTLGNVSDISLSPSLRVAESPPLPSAAQLITEHKTGVMPEAHPFAFAVDASVAYRTLLDCVEDEITVLLLKSSTTSRYAFIREDASDTANLKADRHISGQT